jgi:hypothetical protein
MHSRYPTAIGYDGVLRYTYRDCGYPTVESLEKSLRAIEIHTATCTKSRCRSYHGTDLLLRLIPHSHTPTPPGDAPSKYGHTTSCEKKSLGPL